MKRRHLWALILTAVVAIMLLLNAGARATISFRLFDLNASRAMIYFALTALGVVIGLLLR